PKNTDPSAIPRSSAERTKPSSARSMCHSAAMPGDAKLIERTSKPSRALRPIVMAMMATCSAAIGSLAMMSRGSLLLLTVVFPPRKTPSSAAYWFPSVAFSAAARALERFSRNPTLLCYRLRIRYFSRPLVVPGTEHNAHASQDHLVGCRGRGIRTTRRGAVARVSVAERSAQSGPVSRLERAGAARGGWSSRSFGSLGNLLSIDSDGAAKRPARPVALSAESGRRRAARPHALDAADRSEGAAARDVLRHRREHPGRSSVSALGEGAAREAHGRKQ